MGKRGTRRSWGESRRPTRSASSFSASPSANPVSTRKRTATPACPSPTPVRGGTMCSTCVNRSSASARRRPIAACVSTRAPRPARWPSAMGDPSPRVIPDAVHEADAMPRTRRFERSAPERRGRFSRGDDHGPTARAPEAPTPLLAPSRRRTVEITGRTVGAPTLPRLVQIDRRRPARRRRRARGRQARPARAVGRRPGLLPDLRRGDEHVACGHARAQRGRGQRPARAPAGRSHSHGDAARCPPGALNTGRGGP